MRKYMTGIDRIYKDGKWSLGRDVDEWINENHPKNGLFRVYYKKEKGNPAIEGVSLKDEGYGLRYEWYYKDGKRADGIAKGWYQGGQLKNIKIYKDGKLNGLQTDWFQNGQKYKEQIYKDGKWDYNGLNEWDQTGKQINFME